MSLLQPSYLFLFVPVVVLAFHALRKLASPKAAVSWLLIASFVAYACESPAGLPVLVLSIIFNHSMTRWLRRERDVSARQKILFATVGANLLVLSIFKYLPASGGMGWLGAHQPLGISFFTFQQLMFVIDAFQGTTEPLSLKEYGLLTAFFPSVAAGPLFRARTFVSQLADPIPASRPALGLFLFCCGLFKKLVIASALAPMVTAGFGDGAPLGLLTAWLTAAAALLRVYFDLSGYADLAIGTAMLLGIALPPNFDRPLAAGNISAFWQRWHMTLTHFFFDYLFYPLTRAFGKPSRLTIAVATLATMSVIGVWHGARQTYLVFGIMQGLALVVHQVWTSRKRPLSFPLAWSLTMLFLLVSFVVFNAPTLAHAGYVLRAMIGFSHAEESLLTHKLVPEVVTFGLILSMLVGALERSHTEPLFERFVPSRRALLLTVLAGAISILVLISTPEESFVYLAF